MRDFESAVLSCYQPKLVPLEPNLTAAVFPFMKIYPAEFCLRCAAEEGWLRPQTLVVESSSGNLALGLAVVCNLRKLRLTIVSDYACDGPLKARLKELGAGVKIVSAPAKQGGYQRARLAQLEEIRAREKDSFWVNQYDNPCNPGAYSPFASQLIETLGEVDCLVGTVGSGGSMCGTGKYLREFFPEMTMVGVDTFGSVLFGQRDGPRQLRGLGNSLLPKNLDHSMFDEVHWVTAAEAYRATRLLHRQTSLFCGGTSGAAWMVAAWWAKMHPKAKVACILPDDGVRYIYTIYDNNYLVSSGLYLPELPNAPRLVDAPEDAGPSWSRIEWGRRAHEETTGISSANLAAVSV